MTDQYIRQVIFVVVIHALRTGMAVAGMFVFLISNNTMILEHGGTYFVICLVIFIENLNEFLTALKYGIVGVIIFFCCGNLCKHKKHVIPIIFVNILHFDFLSR